MPIYDFENLVRAWSKSAFGLFVGFSFYYAFNSVFLGVLAATFFFFIPISNPTNERVVNSSIFGFAMLIILFWAFGFGISGSSLGLGLDLGISSTLSFTGAGLFLVFIGLGVTAAIRRGHHDAVYYILGAIAALIVGFIVLQPWNWATSAIIFVAIWVIGFAAGVGGTVATRPGMGAVVVFVCFIIFTAGVGTQDVGVAFFGEWWPTVYNSMDTVIKPMSAAWTQMSGTVGDAWMLMTNPVGYATRLMNGSYTPGSVGPTGAYGVELTGYDISPILIEQPYTITTTIKNNGDSVATDLKVRITAGSDSPFQAAGTLGSLTTKRAKLSDLGIKPPSTDGSVYTCTANSAGDSIDCTFNQNLTKQDIMQISFSGEKISCDASGTYQLRKKVLPVNITMTYGYVTTATLGTKTDKLQFVSKAEWDRLTKDNNLQLTDVSSEYTSSPVIFPIGTSGLKVPIRETQDFHLGLKLASAKKNGMIQTVEYVKLNYPPEFDIDLCYPAIPQDKMALNSGVVTWDGTAVAGKGDKFFYCHFKPITGKLGTSPTKSYLVTAEAKYTYTITQDKMMKVDFGSWCCTQEAESCGSGYTCQAETGTSGKGICVPKPQTGGQTGTPGTCTQPTQPEMQSYIQAAYYATGTEEAMIKAIIMTESSFKHCISGGGFTVSRTGCTGLMQLSQKAVDDVKSPLSSPNFPQVDQYSAGNNVLAGAAYFQILQSRYKCSGNQETLTAYNAGLAYCGKTPPSTSAYSAKVMKYYDCYTRTQNQGWYGPVNDDCSQAPYPNP